MYKWSMTSLNKLKTVHPELQYLFNEVLKYRDCTILEGYRGEQAQNKAKAEGNSTLSYPASKHNKEPALAVDVAPYPIPAWKGKEEDFVYFGGFVMGLARALYDAGKMKHELRYGGDFNKNDRITDSTLFDLVHFELIV